MSASLFKPVVHILASDALVRDALDVLLSSVGLGSIFYESPIEILAAAPALAGGCILLDIVLPETDGFEIQARLLQLGVTLPIIVITALDHVSAATRMTKAGALEILQKPYDDVVLLDTINKALALRSRADLEAKINNAMRRIGKLSPRERDILNGLVAGQSNKIIAYELSISVRTVEGHRARMMERLGVHRLAEAVSLAVIAKLAD
jgi:two-component system response regulator FixJ